MGQGGSLNLWRKYFGPDAVLFGVDKNPACAELQEIDAQIRIGDQSDHQFLTKVLNEMGGVDLVIDDGSHSMKYVTASLKFVFPLLNSGGVYLIEDMHTAYWSAYGGGFSAQANLFNLVRELFDDVHRWYHQNKVNHPGLGDACSGIHVHDSMVVLEKSPGYPPVHSTVG